MGSRRSAAALSTLLVLGATGCGLMGSEQDLGGDGTSPREQRASRMVSAQAGENVECKDNGAVNVEIHPEYPVGFSCYNEAGEFYNAVITPDGQMVSFSGPVRLKPAEDS